MNAGVGASGAGEAHGFGRDTAERLLEHALERWHGRLSLPARVRAAIVFDANGDSHHGRNSCTTGPCRARPAEASATSAKLRLWLSEVPGSSAPSEIMRSGF